GSPGHDIVAKAVEAVANLSHRGAVAADGKSGDGSGVLTQIPRKLLAREATRLGVNLTEADPFGVGMFFLPDQGGESCVERSLAQRGLQLLAWRDVPVDPSQLGDGAKATLPRIRQALVVGEDLE